MTLALKEPEIQIQPCLYCGHDQHARGEKCGFKMYPGDLKYPKSYNDGPQLCKCKAGAHWYDALGNALGNAIGESLFGGGRLLLAIMATTGIIALCQVPYNSVDCDPQMVNGVETKHCAVDSGRGELWVRFPPKCISKVQGALECPEKDGKADCKDPRARFAGAVVTFNGGCAEAVSFVKKGDK